MAGLKDVDIHINDLMRKQRLPFVTVNIHLKGMKGFRFRLWLAKNLIVLACWVSRGIVGVESDA